MHITYFFLRLLLKSARLRWRVFLVKAMPLKLLAVFFVWICLPFSLISCKKEISQKSLNRRVAQSREIIKPASGERYRASVIENAMLSSWIKNVDNINYAQSGFLLNYFQFKSSNRLRIPYQFAFPGKEKIRFENFGNFGFLLAETLANRKANSILPLKWAKLITNSFGILGGETRSENVPSISELKGLAASRGARLQTSDFSGFKFWPAREVFHKTDFGCTPFYINSQSSLAIFANKNGGYCYVFNMQNDERKAIPQFSSRVACVNERQAKYIKPNIDRTRLVFPIIHKQGNSPAYAEELLFFEERDGLPALSKVNLNSFIIEHNLQRYPDFLTGINFPSEKLMQDIPMSIYKCESKSDVLVVGKDTPPPVFYLLVESAISQGEQLIDANSGSILGFDPHRVQFFDFPGERVQSFIFGETPFTCSLRGPVDAACALSVLSHSRKIYKELSGELSLKKNMQTKNRDLALVTHALLVQVAEQMKRSLLAPYLRIQAQAFLRLIPDANTLLPLPNWPSAEEYETELSNPDGINLLKIAGLESENWIALISFQKP